MTYSPKLPPTIIPKDVPNNKAILNNKFAIDMLTGAQNMKSLDRAVRVGELLDSGQWKLDPNSGLLVPGAATSGDSAFSLAGKNRLINGNFDVFHRGSFGNVTAAAVYTADRWVCSSSAAGVTSNWEIGTPAPGEIKGAKRFLGFNVVPGAQSAWMGQHVENVESLANGKATTSFFMRSSVAGKKVGVMIQQVFGSGGSATIAVEGAVITLGTAFAKHTVTFNVPSISGKTIGANDNLFLMFFLCDSTLFSGQLVNQSGLFELAQVQLEEGSKATVFEFVPPEQNLALCYRYCEPVEMARLNGITFTVNGDTRAARPFKVRKRANPSLTYTGSLDVIGCGPAGFVLNINLGVLQWDANTGVVTLGAIGNPAGIAPAGTVVTWGDNGAGQCTVLADSDF